MATETFRQKIARRMPARSASYVEVVEHFVTRYKMRPDIKNFLGGGFIGTDTAGRTFSLLEVENRANKLYFPEPKTEVIVLVDGFVILGWVRAKKAKQIEDRWSVPVGALQPLPTELSFEETCMHLSKHGGWSLGESWFCFGCDRELVFNDIPVKRAVRV